jgi:hypothetical protein
MRSGCRAKLAKPSPATPVGSLALVRAPYLASVGFPQNVVAAWYDSHQLWLYDPAHRSLRKLDASGASVPTWAADGKSLLYVAGDGLWLLPSLSGRPVPIAGPLFAPDNWPSFYGQVNWLSQFASWPG